MRKKGSKAKAVGKAPIKHDVPDVYREMLAEAVSSSPIERSDDGRAVKRRRVGGRVITQTYDESAFYQSDQSSKAQHDSDLGELFEDVYPNRQQVTKSDTEDSAESDSNWEEVDLSEKKNQEGAHELREPGLGDLHLVFHDEDHERISSARGRSKQKPITAEEKILRLDIHKMHLCSLLAHVYLRNHWCNDNSVHLNLRKLLTQKTTSYLNPDHTMSQFQRSRSFMDGLEQASAAFHVKFKVQARGMSRSRWAENAETLALLQPPDDIDLPTHITDFRENALKLRGSRDIGAQLFCALLRSAGVEARLVCSLLPLPFQPAQKIELFQVRQHAAKVANSSRAIVPGSEDELIPGSDGSSLGSSLTPEPSSRLPGRSKARSPIRESKYPVYWVEAFNEAVQKWVPLDPLVTKSIAKSSKFEPPAGEPENHMSYVVAFEDDGSARDVTRRYVKAYNAKTRRHRVEVTKGGEKWWRSAMRIYRRCRALDRDQVEDVELAGKEAAEPMPRNVQDFKDHPYYALERHLKRQEIIHPKREVGKVGTGRAGNATILEPIYRRGDVHIANSGDKWYRMGREIKPGEQPLKRVPTRRARERSLNPDSLDPPDEDDAGTGLYAAFQTALYVAPPVINSRIPKNVYGNLDLYVPSMVPPGGVHIVHPETARAAKLLVIDYADAVTGFSFKGRHGTAITKGAVVANEYREAIEVVIRGFEDERTHTEEARRSKEVIRMWKRLLAGLRIKQRIDGYEIEGERDAAMQAVMENADNIEDNEEGGFLPGTGDDEYAHPTAGMIETPNVSDATEDESGGFLVENVTNEQHDQAMGHGPGSRAIDRFVDNLDDDSGGGFLVNDGLADAEDELREAKNDGDEHRRLDNITPIGQITLDLPHAKHPGNELTDATGEATINISHNEVGESRMLEQLYEAGATTAIRPDLQATSLSNDALTAEETERTESEKGSLLSHDPDDEDADPYWLS